MFPRYSAARVSMFVLWAFGAMLLLPTAVFAHCDTLDGPVVKDAQKALEKSDVTPVLKWVQAKDESEIKKAFDKTLKVRTKGDDARDLADMYFFETLVRVHRAGEGVAFTGVKPAGAEVDAGIEAADKAIETGSPDEMMKHLSGKNAEEIRKEFNAVMEKQKQKDQSVEAGRGYVEAYVKFIHHVEAAMAKPGAKKDAHHDYSNHSESAADHSGAAHSESATNHDHAAH